MCKSKIKIFSDKIVSIFLMGVYLMALTSCFSIEEIPYGIWQSNDPGLTLYIIEVSEKTGLYSGEYELADRIKKIEICIDMSKGGWMRIDYPEALTEDGHLKDGMDYTLFSGYIKVNNNKLIYRLKSAYQEKTGYKEILFEKIGDYSPPSSLSPIVADVVKKPNGAI